MSNLICFPFSCKEGGAIVVFLSDLIIVHFEVWGRFLSRFSKPHRRRTVLMMVVTLMLSEHRNAGRLIAWALDRCRCRASLVHRNSMLISSGNWWWLGCLALICCWTYPKCNFLSTLVFLQLLFIAFVEISISQGERIVLWAFRLRCSRFQDHLGEVFIRRRTPQSVCSLCL